MNDRRQVPEPVTPAAKALKLQVSAERWTEIVAKAMTQASIVNRVREIFGKGDISMGQALRSVSPQTPWPTFQYWCSRLKEEKEADWELFLDRRIPPRPAKISEAVRSSAATLRMTNPAITFQEARVLLVRQHGESAQISDSSLLRIWHGAGFMEANKIEGVVEKQFHGGAGLAFIAAAVAETGASVALAEAVQAEALLSVERLSKMGLEIRPEPAGRDEKGHLTARYNREVRANVASGKPDARWEPDYKKRQQRDLGGLQVLAHQTPTVSMKLLCIGLVPLITGRRGFDGLDGPFGEWLGVLGGVAYKPATLDKFLAQLALLDVEDALWQAHAIWSRGLANRWSSADDQPAWLRLVIYIDSTQDPHWTYNYAKSGKISRTGRVSPCLSRVMITSGPGVPILMETYPGTVSLKTELPRLLQRVDGVIGEGELGRITLIMDAEMATPKLITMLKSDERRNFITVLKGVNVARNFSPSSDWQSYRERDELREGVVRLHGETAPKEGVEIRAVQMRREGHHSQSTFFGSDLTEVAAPEIVDAYLSRWPHQEQLFRNARNGLGLEKTHGYGGELVQHVAYDTKKAKAERRCVRAEADLKAAQQAVLMAEDLAKKSLKLEKSAAAELYKTAKARVRSAQKALGSSKKEVSEVETTPREIYERDTARENVVTALTMTILTLIEYVLREYFGGLRMELRTFIEHFVNLPVTLVESSTECRYHIHSNARNSERAHQVRAACEEITRRRISQRGKLLVFQVAETERKRLTVRQ